MPAGRRRATWVLGPLLAIAAVLAMHGLDDVAVAVHGELGESSAGDHAGCDDCPHAGHLVVICGAVVGAGVVVVARAGAARRVKGFLSPVRSSPAPPGPRPRRRAPAEPPPAWVRLEVILC